MNVQLVSITIYITYYHTYFNVYTRLFMHALSPSAHAHCHNLLYKRAS